MSFYQSIAEVYNKIFPLNPGQVEFVSRMFPEAGDLTLLDVGCGTGLLSQALSFSFKKVMGIDLDEAMLAEARTSANQADRPAYFMVDMLEIDRHFEPESFDCLVCFGNTLVHLPSLAYISDFCKKSYDLLGSRGKLLIQIIHYDRILDQHIGALPTLENNDIQFIRKYHYLKDIHQIEFETILTIKKKDQIIRNRVGLYPVVQSEMEACLRDAGFKDIRFYGNFKGEPLSAESIPMVIEACKG